MLQIVCKAAIIAGLVFVVALVAMTVCRPSSPPTNPQEQQHNNETGDTDEKNTTQENRKISQEVGCIVRWLDAHNGFVSAIGTVFVAFFTLCLVIATIALFQSSEKSANAAKASAEVATKALIASRRPWVMVDVNIVGAEFNNGFRLTLNFSLENKGNDPALYAFPHFEIISKRDRGPGFVKSESERYCGEIKGRPPGVNTGGFTIFPGQARSMGMTATMLQSAIDADIAAGFPVQKEGGPYMIRPIIIGCVDYQFSLSPDRHQTRFAYEIWDKGFGGFGLTGNLVLVTPGVVENTRLTLVPMLIDRDAFYAD